MGWMSAIVTPTRTRARWTIIDHGKDRKSVSLETRPVGDKMLERKPAPGRRGLGTPIESLEIRPVGEKMLDWGTCLREAGTETRLWPIEWGSICCSSVRSPTSSRPQPFQIKWEVYFSKNCVARLYCVVVMILHASAYEYTTQPLIYIYIYSLSKRLTF